jgi:hypothetical protein
LARGVKADVLGPYTADSGTLHLYHVNEAADNAEDSGFVDWNDIDLKMHNPAATGAGYSMEGRRWHPERQHRHLHRA